MNMHKQFIIEGYQRQILEAHSKLNEVIQRASLLDPDEVRKPMRYPCDPDHPMTEINSEYQTLLREIKEASERIGELRISRISQ